MNYGLKRAKLQPKETCILAELPDQYKPILPISQHNRNQGLRVGIDLTLEGCFSRPKTTSQTMTRKTVSGYRTAGATTKLRIYASTR